MKIHWRKNGCGVLGTPLCRGWAGSTAWSFARSIDGVTCELCLKKLEVERDQMASATR